MLHIERYNKLITENKLPDFIEAYTALHLCNKYKLTALYWKETPHTRINAYSFIVKAIKRGALVNTANLLNFLHKGCLVIDEINKRGRLNIKTFP